MAAAGIVRLSTFSCMLASVAVTSNAAAAQILAHVENGMESGDVASLAKELQKKLDKAHSSAVSTKGYRGSLDLTKLVTSDFPRGMELHRAEEIFKAAGLKVTFYDTRKNTYREKNPPVILAFKSYTDSAFKKSTVTIAIHTANSSVNDGVVDRVEALLTTTSL